MENNEEVLNLKFKICDNLQYEVNDNGIVTIFEKQDHKIQKFFRKLRFKIPLYKKIDFDEISSEVFLLIDGKRTVREIGENLKLKYGDEVNPLYERLLVFLNHIHTNCNYIEII